MRYYKGIIILTALFFTACSDSDLPRTYNFDRVEVSEESLYVFEGSDYTMIDFNTGGYSIISDLIKTEEFINTFLIGDLRSFTFDEEELITITTQGQTFTESLTFFESEFGLEIYDDYISLCFLGDFSYRSEDMGISGYSSDIYVCDNSSLETRIVKGLTRFPNGDLDSLGLVNIDLIYR